MSILVAQGANNSSLWPSVVFNAPAQSNLQVYEVRLVLNYFVEEHPLVNNSFLCGEEHPTVNAASNPDVWTHAVTAVPPMPQIKANGMVMSLQIGQPGGAAFATGVQIPFTVTFESQAQKYPLLPENLAL